jgi:hypothetical protein
MDLLDEIINRASNERFARIDAALTAFHSRGIAVSLRYQLATQTYEICQGETVLAEFPPPEITVR